MRRKLLALNLILLALTAALTWHLRARWLEAQARREAVRSRPVQPAPVAPAVLPPQQAPVAAAGYNEVAQKMLFVKDRNPEVIIEVEPPKPMPPFPVAHGVMALGGPPVAILSEKPGAPHRGYRPGEKVGEFKLVAASTQELVLEWDGKQIVKKIEELREKAVPQQTAAAAAQPPGPVRGAPASPPTPPPAPAKPGPGVALGGEIRACTPGDASPAGTVIDGMRKVVTRTPFGEACRWEPIK